MKPIGVTARGWPESGRNGRNLAGKKEYGLLTARMARLCPTGVLFASNPKAWRDRRDTGAKLARVARKWPAWPANGPWRDWRGPDAHSH